MHHLQLPHTSSDEVLYTSFLKDWPDTHKPLTSVSMLSQVCRARMVRISVPVGAAKKCMFSSRYLRYGCQQQHFIESKVKSKHAFKSIDTGRRCHCSIGDLNTSSTSLDLHLLIPCRSNGEKNPRVIHYQIKQTETAEATFYLAEKYLFSTIPELIHYHQHNAAGKCAGFPHVRRN